ncbi:MAG TPA: T9SS type A sorting domain-containing protein, partial [bacterium]|nr:T9SS type A sorting domain-containing protein [bacterium]
TVTNLQIYPNPIRMDLHNTLNIKFDLRKTASVVFEVYSISGKRMVHHNYGKFDPNNHLLNWDIKDNAGKFLPSGIYIYRLNIGDYSKTGKIAVVR